MEPTTPSHVSCLLLEYTDTCRKEVYKDIDARKLLIVGTGRVSSFLFISLYVELDTQMPRLSTSTLGI